MPAYNYCSLLRNPVCILLALPFGSIFFMIFVSLHFSVIFFYSLFTVLYWMTEYCLWNIVFFVMLDWCVFAFICDSQFLIYLFCIEQLNIAYENLFFMLIVVSLHLFVIIHSLFTWCVLEDWILLTEWQFVFHSQLMFLRIHFWFATVLTVLEDY